MYVNLISDNLTSNIAPEGKVIYSSQYGEGYAFNIFNNQPSQRWRSNGFVPQYIGFSFNKPTLVNIIQYIKNGNIRPKSITLQGSFNDLEWEDIKVYDDLIEGVNRLILPNESPIYKGYRLMITAYTTRDWVDIDDIKFYASYFIKNNSSNTHIWSEDNNNVKLNLLLQPNTIDKIKYRVMVNDNEFLSISDYIDVPANILIDIPKNILNNLINNIKFISISDEMGFEHVFEYNIRKEDISTTRFIRDFISKNQWSNITDELEIVDNELKLLNKQSILTTDNETLIHTDNKYNIINVEIESSDDTSDFDYKNILSEKINSLGEGEVYKSIVNTKDFRNKIIKINI